MKKLKNENSKFIKDLTNVDVAIKFYQYRLTFYNQLEKNDTKHDRNICLDQLDKFCQKYSDLLEQKYLSSDLLNARPTEEEIRSYIQRLNANRFDIKIARREGNAERVAQLEKEQINIIKEGADLVGEEEINDVYIKASFEIAKVTTEIIRKMAKDDISSLDIDDVAAIIGPVLMQIGIEALNLIPVYGPLISNIVGGIFAGFSDEDPNKEIMDKLDLMDEKLDNISAQLTAIEQQLTTVQNKILKELKEQAQEIIHTIGAEITYAEINDQIVNLKATFGTNIKKAIKNISDPDNDWEDIVEIVVYLNNLLSIGDQNLTLTLDKIYLLATGYSMGDIKIGNFENPEETKSYSSKIKQLHSVIKKDGAQGFANALNNLHGLLSDITSLVYGTAETILSCYSIAALKEFQNDPSNKTLEEIDWKYIKKVAKFYPEEEEGQFNLTQHNIKLSNALNYNCKEVCKISSELFGQTNSSFGKGFSYLIIKDKIDNKYINNYYDYFEYQEISKVNKIAELDSPWIVRAIDSKDSSVFLGTKNPDDKNSFHYLQHFKDFIQDKSHDDLLANSWLINTHQDNDHIYYISLEYLDQQDDNKIKSLGNGNFEIRHHELNSDQKTKHGLNDNTLFFGDINSPLLGGVKYFNSQKTAYLIFEEIKSSKGTEKKVFTPKLYDDSNNQLISKIATKDGVSIEAAFCLFTDNGNLVLQDENHNPIWHALPENKENENGMLELIHEDEIFHIIIKSSEGEILYKSS